MFEGRVTILGELHLACRRDLLEHGFHRRWATGDLSMGEYFELHRVRDLLHAEGLDLLTSVERAA